MEIRRTITLIAAVSLLSVLTGCWYLVAGGAGAVGGYELKKEGYEVQSPITKEKKAPAKEPAKSTTK